MGLLHVLSTIMELSVMVPGASFLSSLLRALFSQLVCLFAVCGHSVVSPADSRAHG